MKELRRPIAMLRILIGAAFVAMGTAKLMDADFLYGGLVQTMEAAGRAFPFYESFLARYVELHQTFFANVVALGELLLGISYFTGTFVSLSSLAGAFMVLNFMLATCYGAPGRLAAHLAGVALLLAMGWMGAGLTWGLDRWLVSRSRSTFVLLPLRRRVPGFQKS